MQVKGWIPLVVLTLTVGGCGVMGPPVPPNSIGVNVKREADRQQKMAREQRSQESQKGPGQDRSARPPQAPSEQTPGLSVDALLQDEIVQPSARPDSDFLVRPR